MQQKEESGSLLWCVAEDLKNTINGMNEDEARVVVTDFEAGTHDLKTCEKAIHDYANKHKAAVLPAAPASRAGYPARAFWPAGERPEHHTRPGGASQTPTPEHYGFHVRGREYENAGRIRGHDSGRAAR